MATQKSFTKKQIDDAIDSQMADNTSQAITASNVRSITKDYMTGSMAAPMLIYAGIIKAGSDAASATVKDLYYNPDFFQQVSESSPTFGGNTYELSTISVPGASDGEYDIYDPVNKGTLLHLKITVASNVITKMEVISPGVGYINGDTWTITVGPNNVDVTYNGVIRAEYSSTPGIGQYFNLTENTNNTFKNHSQLNTIISASIRNINFSSRSGGGGVSSTDTLNIDNNILNSLSSPQGISRAFFRASEDDFLTLAYVEQYIQLFRIAGTDADRSGY